jgi:hypothetical protein
MNYEHESTPLPKYQPAAIEKNFWKSKRKIIGVRDTEQVTGLATSERVAGRKILEWSPYCGTYGQGGPGFFGLKLEAKDQIPEEWLILTLWSASDWLEQDGRWITAHPNQYQIQKPLYSNYAGSEKIDEVTPLLKDKVLKRFEVKDKSTVIEIDGTTLAIHKDPAKRPLAGGSHEPLALEKGESLKNAWIISPVPWVQI